MLPDRDVFLQFSFSVTIDIMFFPRTFISANIIFIKNYEYLLGKKANHLDIQSRGENPLPPCVNDAWGFPLAISYVSRYHFSAVADS